MATVSSIGEVVAGFRGSLEIILGTSAKLPTLAGVTGMSLRVFRRGGVGAEETWTITIVSQTASKIVAAHPWVAGENDTVGEALHIYPQLDISGTTIESSLVVVTVKAR